MRRYQHLEQKDVNEALNGLRAAFLAAKDGEQVDEIIKAVITEDEQLKIGRRIRIAQLIELGLTIESIVDELKVGKNTVIQVARQLESYEKGFALINKREELVEEAYRQRAYSRVGGSKKVVRTREYTGFSRKEVRW